MRTLLRDPCQCQPELGGIVRIIEVSFVSFKFVREGGWGTYDLCECQAEISKCASV